MTTNHTNHSNDAGDTHAPEFDAVVDLLQADAMLHAGAADARFEARIAAATLNDLNAVRHTPTLRLAGEGQIHQHRRWAGGLRLAAAVAFLATVTAAFMAVRGPASSITPTVTVASATMPTVIEDWDILLGSESTATLASGSESLLTESENIGKRWSSEYSDSDWTIIEEGSM